MNSAILNELNRIRLLEQKKLLDPLRNLLNTNKKIGRLHDSLELFKNLSILHEEPFTDNNYETAIANYNKLRGMLLLMLNKHKQIKTELNKIENNLNKLKEFQVDDTKDFPLENTHELTAGISISPLVYELETSVSSIKDEMMEFIQKLKSKI